MILVDYNQVMLASLFAGIGNHTNMEVDENLLRHMFLNSIRFNRKKFSKEYGEIVICADNTNVWRKDYYPYYKANRKKNRDADSKDWNAIFEILNKIKAEIKDNLPYKFLEVYGAEADDIIATLCKYTQTEKDRSRNEKIIIVSGDKDFIQLQKYMNVKQYSPILKKYVDGHVPETYIKEHILKGDTSDGVPNVLSPDNTFTDGLRQRPLGKKKIETWLDIDIDDLQDEVKRNYQRNEKLIDLSKIPNELEDEILTEFHGAPFGDRSKLLNYFIKSRLKNLTETIGEF